MTLPEPLKRLGKNINGYFGETIELRRVLADCLASAARYGWTADTLKASPKPDLLALRRAALSSAASSAPHVYISAGIHGDEPAGPLAICEMLAQNLWPAGVQLSLCPCLNPTGFELNRRENVDGTDLNRHYLEPRAEETLAHIRWLQAQPSFTVCLCLHEDWESHGFYLYELNPDSRPSLAPMILAAAARVCPLDLSEIIEGRPAVAGLIKPSLDPHARPQWPESFYLLTHKTRLSYTFEAPSDFPLLARVKCLTAAVQAALEAIMDFVPVAAPGGNAID